MAEVRLAWCGPGGDDRASSTIRVENPKPAQKVFGLPLGNEVTGILTHYIGRTIPCTKPHACDSCARFIPARYKGYVPCVTIDGAQRFLMELQKKNVLMLETKDYAEMDWRTLLFVSDRIGKHRNSPVRLRVWVADSEDAVCIIRQYTPLRFNPATRPPWFNPRENLMAMWGYSRSEIERGLLLTRRTDETEENPPFEKKATPGGENHDPRI